MDPKKLLLKSPSVKERLFTLSLVRNVIHAVAEEYEFEHQEKSNLIDF